jgi:hypothetical protein
MTASTTAAHRVLLVREWDQQTTGSGCCGRLEGGSSELAATDAFTRTRGDMERMGAVYRALRDELPNLDVQIVDPRNVAFLIPGLLGDARRHGLSWSEAWRALRRGSGPGAIIVDGRVVSVGTIPDADEAVGLVLHALATPSR